MKKQLLLALLVCGLIGTAAADTIGMEAISINTDPAPLQAGDDADLDFKIRNGGSEEATDITVSINDSYPFTVKNDRQRTFELGDVQPLSEYYISTEILVEDDAPDGVNTLPVTIANDAFSVTKELRLDVEQNTADLQLANLQTTPTQITADMEDVTLSLDVVNQGETDAENTVMNLDLPPAFEQVSTFSSRSSLGTISPGEQKTATFTVDIVDDARSGELNLPVTVRYGEEENEYEVEDRIALYLAGRPQLDLTGATGGFRVGEQGTIRLNVTNEGSEDAEATRVRAMEAAELPLEFDSASQYVGTLEPGQNGSAVFDVTVDGDAPAKDYLLDFRLRGVNDETVYVNDVTISQPVSDTTTGSSSLVPYVLVALLLVAGIGVYAYARKA
jgi:hypothetical protein